MSGRPLSDRGANARRVAVLVLAFTPVLGACSGILSGSPSESGSSSVTDRFTSFFLGPQVSTATNGVAGPATNIECPIMDVRNGASTLSVNADSRDPAATALKYQVTLVRTARECAVVGSDMRVKAGVQGRVILGPAGGPGPVEVPLRFAVVAEGPEPSTITTKLYRIPVTVGPDQSMVPFTHVDENLTFPMPKAAADLDSYVIYVGFDPTAMEKPAPRKPPPAKKRRSG